MKKIVVTLGLMVTLLLMLSGCSKKGVSMSQLKTDIGMREEILNCFSSKYVSHSLYKLTDCTISKEQLNIEDKEDIIFCEVTLENAYFKVEISAKCVYLFYDKGDWILEEFSCKIKDVVAKRAPDLEELDKLVYYGACDSDNRTLSYYYRDKETERYEYGELWGGELKILDCALNEDLKSATISCTYKSKCVDFKGSYNLVLQEDGWGLSKDDIKIYGEKDQNPILMLDYDADFTSAVGDFVWTDDDGSLYKWFSIHEIKEGYVTYSLYSNWANGVDGLNTGENIKVEFDSFSGQFNISKKGNMYLQYNVEEDIWYSGQVYERILQE